MAWVSRTSRDNNKIGAVDVATKNIGPGSYSLSGSIMTSRPSHAPFGTTDARKFDNGCMVTPGPGTYSASTTHACCLNASGSGASMAFRSKTKRSQSGMSTLTTPGPGSYEVQPPEFVRMKKTIQKSPASNDDAVVQWVRLPTAPSIPDIHQSFGYDVGHRGQLIMQKPTRVGYTGRPGDTVGPGEYQTASGIFRNKRAVNFGASKVRRSFVVVVVAKPSCVCVCVPEQYPHSLTTFPQSFRGSADHNQSSGLPGPGQYTIVDPTRFGDEGAQKPSAAFQATGRSSSSKPSKTATMTPGPGAYQLTGSVRLQKKPQHLQFFGSTQARFEDQKYVCVCVCESVCGHVRMLLQL